MEFFQSCGGFAIPLFLLYLNFTYIWKWLHSGHVLVKSGTDSLKVNFPLCGGIVLLLAATFLIFLTYYTPNINIYVGGWRVVKL